MGWLSRSRPTDGRARFQISLPSEVSLFGPSLSPGETTSLCSPQPRVFPARPGKSPGEAALRGSEGFRPRSHEVDADPGSAVSRGC